MPQQIHVVETRDGDAPRHCPAAALAFEQRPNRQHLAGEETGIEIGMGVHQPHQRLGALAEAPGRFEDEARVGRPAEFGEGREVAAAALLGTVVVAHRQGDEADLAVAETRQVERHGARGLEVRVADRHVERIVGQVAGLDHRHAAGFDQLAHPLAVDRVVQDEAADALRQEGGDQRLLVLQPMAAVGDHQRQAVGAQRVGRRLDHAGVERVADAGHDQPDDVGAARRQAAGDPVGQVGELAHRGIDLAPHLLRHRRRLAQRA